MDFDVSSTTMAVREHGIKCGSLPVLDYADDFSILEENFSKMN